jgi:DNA-binding MarR family transcriptional regulator
MTGQAYKKLRWCACPNLRGATRLITQFYDKQMKPSSLRVTQFNLPFALAIEGSITVTHLAEKLHIDRTTLTRNLNLLEHEGLIEN